MSYKFMIENDHEIIFSLVKKLCSSARLGFTPHECEGIFSKIIEKLQDHFKTEEKAMHLHGYPEIEAHRDAHLELLKLFREIGDSLVGPDGKLYLGKLERGELKITDHVCSHDIELTHFLRDKKVE
jgi:hemerythrin-like metal-binding protein